MKFKRCPAFVRFCRNAILCYNNAVDINPFNMLSYASLALALAFNSPAVAKDPATLLLPISAAVEVPRLLTIEECESDARMVLVLVNSIMMSCIILMMRLLFYIEREPLLDVLEMFPLLFVRMMDCNSLFLIL